MSVRAVERGEVFEAADFDLAGYINALFKTKADKAELPEVLARVTAKEAQINSEISRKILVKSSMKVETRERLGRLQGDMAVLLERVESIRQQSQTAEHMVEDLCADIKGLEAAKGNLSSALTALHNLFNLKKMITSLDGAVQQKRYDVVLASYLAARDFRAYFSAYSGYPSVAGLFGQLSSIEDRLEKQLKHDIEYRDTLGEKEIDFQAGLLTIEAISVARREAFIRPFVADPIAAFGAQFSLENLETDFLTVARSVQRYGSDGDMAGVWPGAWLMEKRLIDRYASEIREGIVRCLEASAASMSVEALIIAIQSTTNLEGILAEKLVELSETVEEWKLKKKEISDDSHLENLYTFEVQREMDETGCGGIEEAMTGGGIVDRLQQHLQQHEAKRRRQVEQYRGFISHVFDPYMKTVVEKMSRQLQEEVEGLKRAETWVASEPGSRIATSAYGIMRVYSDILKQSVKLSRGQALYDIYKGAVRGSLTDYCGFLRAQSPQADGSLAREQKLLMLLESSLYCMELCERLSVYLVRHIDEAFRNSIEFSPCKKAFSTLADDVVTGLAVNLSTRLADDVAGIKKMDWKRLESVGDCSAYVTKVADDFSAFLSAHAHLGPRLGFLLDQFVSAFAPKFGAHLPMAAPIHHVAAEQLLLDAQSLRGVLMSVPKSRVDIRLSKRYTKVVSREFTRIESVLKVLLAATDENLSERYQSLVRDSSEEGFKYVLELRGLKSDKQSGFMRKYSNMISIPKVPSLNSFKKV